MKKHATTAQINSLDKALWNTQARADRLRRNWLKQNGAGQVEDLDETARYIAECLEAISASCEEAFGLIEEYVEQVDAEEADRRNSDPTYRTIPATMIWNPNLQGRVECIASAENCQVCGRPVGADPVGIIVVDGGASIIHPDDNVKAVADGGYMGWWPIGSECAKKIPAEYLTK